MCFWLKHDAGLGDGVHEEGLFIVSGMDSMTNIEYLDAV